TYPAHIEVTDLAFSSDGREILTASEYDRPAVKVWDADTGELLLTHGNFGFDEFRSVAFSPDATKILIAGWGSRFKTMLFEIGSGTLIRNFGRYSSHVVFSPNGSKVLTMDPGGDTTAALLWDTETGRRLQTLRHNIEGYASIDSRSVTFSPDGGKILAAMHGPPSAAWKLWDTGTGDELWTGSNDISSFVLGDGMKFFTADGKFVTADGNAAILRDAATGEEIRRFEQRDLADPSRSEIRDVAFSPDGTKLATTGWSTVTLWDTTTGQQLYSVQHSDPAYFRVTFSPDGMILVTAGGNAARLWDATTGEELGSLEPLDYAQYVKFSPDGTKLVTMGGGYYGTTARLWDISDLVRKTGIRNFSRY
ncbi:MAG: hypothetical protein ABIH23_11010, partial [bacterium]